MAGFEFSGMGVSIVMEPIDVFIVAVAIAVGFYAWSKGRIKSR